MKKILIVDDEPDIVRLIEITLAKYGYDTITAGNGQEAIDLAKEKKPDLILMDIMLKGEMDGIEAAKQIHYSLDIPIVYLTAYSDDEKLARAKESQPYGYVLKPFEDKELRTTIEISLCKAEAEQQLKTLTRELQVSRANFEGIVGKSGDGAVVVDENNVVKFVNPAAKVMFGLKTEQAIGQKFSFTVKAGQTMDVKIVRSDGIYGAGQIQAVETRWESRPAYLVSITDVTERKKMEDELREKIHSLEVFHKAAVGRELKMIELKEQIAELEAQLVKK